MGLWAAGGALRANSHPASATALPATARSPLLLLVVALRSRRKQSGPSSRRKHDDAAVVVVMAAVLKAVDPCSGC